nr:MAG TPA: hypothetical protein [Podoviridae sp. ctfN46]
MIFQSTTYFHVNVIKLYTLDNNKALANSF